VTARSQLPTRKPPDPVYRLARRPNPWTAPDWAFVHTNDEQRNRYDDPERYYRVLYAGTERFACFAETLARFRPNLALLAELRTIDGADDFVPFSTVPADWLAARCMGSARVGGEFVDVFHSDSITFLRRTLGAACVQLGYGELDAATLRLTAPRHFTQLVSRTIYNLGIYGGIRYASKFGDNLELWAIFEPFEITPGPVEKVAPDDPDLRKALDLHGLRLV
jgi:hypothetical protein